MSRTEVMLIAVNARGEELGRSKVSLAATTPAELFARTVRALDGAYLLDPIDPKAQDMLPHLAAREEDIVSIVRLYAAQIRNGRSLEDIGKAFAEESGELSEEIALVVAGGEPGPDGILGEAMDTAQCAIDAVLKAYPGITNQQIRTMMVAKCQKWLKHYANAIQRDRSQEA